MSHPVTLTVNGKENEVSCGATTTLLTVLRDTLALTGSKRGCIADERLGRPAHQATDVDATRALGSQECRH